MTPDAVAADDEPITIYCPSCGYDLRGIESDRCPECGLALDRARLAVSSLPWPHRNDIGRVRAYWRTVWLVIRNPTRAADDISRPVRFDDAKKFRRVTVLVALAAPLALLAWACVAIVRGRPITMSSTAATAVRIGWLLEILLAPVIVVALYAFLLAASGVASYFFHPKRLPLERQNRAVALSYYACAPMALTPLSIASVTAAWLLIRHDVVTLANVLGFAVVLALAAVAPCVQAFASVTSPLRMLQRATHCGAARAFALAAGLPVLWALLSLIVAIGIPAAYLFVAMVIMSLVA